MPVKARAAKERRLLFSTEILDLFEQIERMPSQRGERYREGSKRLAILLDLSDEWWAMTHVNDRSPSPCHPLGYFAHDAWFRCRIVRAQLLAAVRARIAGAGFDPPRGPNKFDGLLA
jgi:hypothetical protein